MRVAFYAPLKHPGHPRPSGDRRMARALMAALRRAGCSVEIASRLRAYDGGGDARHQRRVARRAAAITEALIGRWSRAPAAARPELWFTYHLYHKAPDWIGAPVSAALGIPYVAAEASFAPKQAQGPWAAGHRAVAAALGGAAAVITMNSADDPALDAVLGPACRRYRLAPFVEARAPRPERAAARAALRARWPLRASVPWLACVAMMREGAKLASYRVLAEALGSLAGADWQLLIAGDGEAAAQVRAAFAHLPPGRVFFVGLAAPAELARLYAAADLFVWPAVGEAYGMALLEAQAAGLAVVAGDAGGVPDIVCDGRTGALCRAADPTAFAAALRPLLDDPAMRERMGRAAREKVLRRHELAVAAGSLARMLAEVRGDWQARAGER